MAVPAPSMYQIPPPEQFSFKANDWESWELRFKRFQSASGLSSKPEQEQVNSLIYLMGPQAEQILISFKLSNAEMEKFDVVLKKFRDHFVPTKNIIYERYRFHTRRQEEGESVEDFITDLHNLSINCDFPATFINSAVRDQVVVGIADKHLSEKLQLDASLTLEKAVTAVRQSEAVKKQQETFKNLNSTGVCAVQEKSYKKNARSYGNNNNNNSGQKGGPNSSNQSKEAVGCNWCGYNKHERSQCPARNAVCTYCQGKGHYAKVCFKKKSTKKNIQEIHAGEESDSDDYFIGEVSSQNTSKDTWITTVVIAGKKLQAKIDTGADVSVIPEAVYREFFFNNKLFSAAKLLTGPNGERLKTIGVLKLKVDVKNRFLNENFYVVQGTKQTLLSCRASEKLGLVRRLFEINQSESKYDFFTLYPELFKGLGNTKNPYEIKLKADAVPYALNVPRRVPLPLRKILKEELDSLCRTGVIERVEEPSEWCAPIVIVPRKNNKIRLCVDFTKLNKCVMREPFSIPDVETTLGQLEGSLYFSKIDANNGFWQIPITANSMKYTTFITPFGRFRSRRLPFGLTTAPEIFQKQISQLLEGLEGVICHIDDIIIHGKTKEEHDRYVKAVLEKFKVAGWTLNAKKCEFNKKSIHVLGHVVSSGYIVPDDKKIKAIQDMNRPKDVTEVKRFLGMVNFISKFVPNLAHIANPLYELLKTGTEFCWNQPQIDAWVEIKRIISNPPVLALYDVSKPTMISVDASSYGLGAILLQKNKDEEFYRPVAYASRTLSASEKSYAQIEKEALAMIWGCEKFSSYIIGKSILIETDHKPLVTVLGKKDLDSLTPRLQRIRLRLMRYEYEVKYTPGRELILADMLSRHPLKAEIHNELEEEITAYVQQVIRYFPASDERLSEIINLQKRDPVCAELIKYSLNSWPPRHKLSQEVIPYWEHRHTITLQENILMKDDRIIVPTQNLRQDILDKLHSGHQGINKCRALARQTVWWPGISSQIENLIKNCLTCIQHEPDQVETLMPSSFPARPWQVVGTDLLKLEGKWYLILTDYYSRYMEIAKLKNLTAECVIEHMKSIFARHGVPESVRSDNGTQFSKTIDASYNKFAKEYGFAITTSSPRYPQSNGFIENQVKIFKNHFKKSKDPYKMLLTLRSSPLASGYSPAELLMGRKLRGIVPISPKLLNPQTPDKEKIVVKEERRIAQQENNFNARHRAVELPELIPGQKVWISDLRQTAIVEKKDQAPRSYMVRSPKGIYRRNRKFLHPLPYMDNSEIQVKEEEDEINLQDLVNVAEEKSLEQNTESKSEETQQEIIREHLESYTPPRKSTRIKRAPDRLNL